MWFSMGIDHSNPYIHSTTVLCDTCVIRCCFVQLQKATYTQHLKERALASLDIFAGGLWKTTVLLWILW